MEVVPGVHQIAGLGQAFLYREADRLTLIDTGVAGTADTIIERIGAIGGETAQLAQIVITHYHADHTGSLADLVERTGAQVLAHALDAPVVRGEATEPRAVPTSEQERSMIREVTKTISPARPCGVDRELADGDEIDIDGGAIAVHVPGHTAGSIAVYVPGRKLLFLGDAAVRDPDGTVLSAVFNVDTAEAQRSFAKLAELDFEVALFAHGAPLDREASRAFRKLAERLAR